MPSKKAAKQTAGRKPAARKHAARKPAARKPAKAASFEELILRYPPVTQAIALRLREIVFEVLPKAEEKVYPSGWSVAMYKDVGNVCGISPMKDRCNFILWQGVHLPDPGGLLEGTGKNMRHVKVASPDDLPVSRIKALIRAGQKFVKGLDGAGR
jgi:hypothetical protein